MPDFLIHDCKLHISVCCLGLEAYSKTGNHKLISKYHKTFLLKKNFFTYIPVKAVVDVVVSVITSASGGAAILPSLALSVCNSLVHTESYKYTTHIVIQKSVVGRGINIYRNGNEWIHINDGESFVKLLTVDTRSFSEWFNGWGC